MYKKLLRPAALAAIEQLAKDVPQHWGTPDDDLDVLAGLVAASRCQRILQFGTAYGLSAVILADIAAQNSADAQLVTVDPMPQMNAAAKHYCDLAGVGGIVTTIDGFSTDPLLFKEFAKQDWDAIYLDTTHQYQDTHDEIEKIHRLCSPRTLFIFHDASQHAAEHLDQRKQGGVARALREFAWLHSSWTLKIFEKPAWGLFGVGLLQKKGV